jgi:hypothetical protein
VNVADGAGLAGLVEVLVEVGSNGTGVTEGVNVGVSVLGNGVGESRSASAVSWASMVWAACV